MQRGALFHIHPSIPFHSTDLSLYHRLITAHASVSLHLRSQVRALQTLAHPLLFSHFPLLSTDAVDSLITLIDEGLLPNLPFPSSNQQLQGQHHRRHQRKPSRPTTPSSSTSSSLPQALSSPPAVALDPLASLQSLVAQTTDLGYSLRGLSDTLHEARHLTSTASRRLRSTLELVAELHREDEDRDEGVHWIEAGNWNRRLKEREAGRVCGDIVNGFETICTEWKEKLFGNTASGTGAEAVAAR